jgi:hypothetical protein
VRQIGGQRGCLGEVGAESESVNLHRGANFGIGAVDMDSPKWLSYFIVIGAIVGLTDNKLLWLQTTL